MIKKRFQVELVVVLPGFWTQEGLDERITEFLNRLALEPQPEPSRAAQAN